MNLVTTAQYLVFEPGLYSVNVAAQRSGPTAMGLTLPCIRIEPVPPVPACPGRATLVDGGEGGWLWPREPPAFIMVLGGRAGVVLTVYRPDAASAPPEVRISNIKTSLAARPEAAGGTLDSGALPLAGLAHLTKLGDVVLGEDGWLGRPGSRAAVEGFQLTPGTTLRPEDIEYQAILGNNWSTPWFGGGEFCGSRGMMLPLLGVSIRLRGKAAAAYLCRYVGRFVGAKASVTAEDGAPCQSDGAALEAIQVVLRARAPASPAEPPPAEATPLTPARTRRRAAVSRST